MATTRQIIDRYYRYLKQRDRGKLLELLGEDIVVTYHAQPGQFPWAGQFHGIAGFDVIASTAGGNRVINQCEGIWEYKNTGHVVKAGMVNIFTVESGKITGYEVYADTAAFAAAFATQQHRTLSLPIN